MRGKFLTTSTGILMIFNQNFSDPRGNRPLKVYLAPKNGIEGLFQHQNLKIEKVNLFQHQNKISD